MGVEGAVARSSPTTSAVVKMEGDREITIAYRNRSKNSSSRTVDACIVNIRSVRIIEGGGEDTLVP